MTQHHHITPELIRAALAHLSAAISREEWARVAMAIKSEYPDSTGFELFDAWSQTAGELYDAKATKDTWRSIKAGGGVSIGTLWFLAKSHGFTFPQGDTAPAPPDPEAAARHARERAERNRAESEQKAAKHEQMAIKAATQWAAASEAGESAYLTRKGVQAHGLRFARDGWLLVPLRDAAGKLWNVQRIAPVKPADGEEKRFPFGGRVSGLRHLFGTTPADPGAVLLLAEGYATGATLHEATGYPVAVAFNSGNLGKAARALREQYPAALLIACGDDDQETEARTGKNIGRIAATAAAKAVNGLALFPPEGLAPGQNFDFNDLHAHHGGPAGLAAVREIVQTGIDAHRVRLATAQAATSPAGKPSRPTKAKSARPAADDDAPDWDRFDVTDAGVLHHGVDRDGNPTKPEFVCSRLDVEALTRDQDGNGWGYLLTFADPQGRPKQWAMPARMLSGDGGEYRAALLNMGLRIAASPRARNLLTQYIQTRQPDENALCTDKTGWHGRAFVLPHETIGDDDERIVFQTDSAMENTIRTRGTAGQWRDRVAALCAGNTRLAFAVSCAFAGPLLRPAGVESGGFHFRGDSSSGKTTALKLAASVWGGSSYLQRWRTTDNALEAIAAQHSDLLLILDELAQVDPKTAGECAYMLANEQSKARATRNGAARPRLSWRLLFLSAGELGLADHMAEGMKRTRAGQEIRMADIPADAGLGLGAFEWLHDQEGGAAFSSHATAQAAAVYGAVGREWLQWLTANTGTLKARIRELSNDLMLSMVPELAGGQVQRVGARFALVGAAGELATVAGLTGWPKGESEKAARACFNAWLAARGGTGNSEVSAMLRQVQGFLSSHGEGRFTWWHRAADDHSAKTLMRAGFRRMVNERGEPIKTDAEHERNYGERITPLSGESVSAEFFILPEVFRGEVCKGFDFEAVCKVLADHGCLMMNEPGRHAKKVKLPGVGQSRCYHIPAKIFELEL
ncbi:DUF927 domain-containing protein [Malikia sp.]|uniref:DUF927 domain-containing protein n=1 Tax=Malikia sp. TaxID=2070706 RepID=UPI00261CE4A2|nr:DUF927 domain-containing protein [Malikia sp.]MDD2729094.1 DUF927 domain-containing protein [Malikia sp.]